MRIRACLAKLGGFVTPKIRSRIEAQHLTDFENPSMQPQRKAAPVLKFQSLAYDFFRILRRPLVTSPTGTALISAPQRGVKGATAPTAPGREPKMRPRKRARTVRGGTAFPPVALRLRLRTGLDPPCGPAAPRSALRRSAPPAGYPEKKA